MGCGHVVKGFLHIISLNSFVDIIRVPKARNSGE